MNNIVTPDILADIDRAKSDIEASKSKEVMVKLYNIGMNYIPEIIKSVNPIIYNWNSIPEEKRLVVMKTAYIFLASNDKVNPQEISFADSIFDEHIFKMFAVDEKKMLVYICRNSFMTTPDANKFAIVSAFIHSIDVPLRNYFQLLLIITSKAKAGKLTNAEALEKLFFMKMTMMEILYGVASSISLVEEYHKLIIANVPLSIEDINYISEHIEFSKLSFIDATKKLHLEKYGKKTE